VHGITIEQLIFFSLVWAVAFIAAFARAVRDREYVSFSNNVAVSCTAGLLAFGSVCILGASDSSDSHGAWYYLGVSALIGLFAKEQDKFGKALLQKVLMIGKELFRDEEKKED
jgi:hypothetical protein